MADLDVSVPLGASVVDALGLNASDELAEGSWYLVTLLEGTDGPIVGDLYAEDADLDGPPSPIETYSLSGALQLSLPAVTAGGFVISGPPTNPSKVPRYGPIDLITQLNARFRPWGKPFAIPPPTDELSANPQPPPPFTSVGVMDIGAGGCNLLIKGNEPWGYYDAGFPIFTYYRSAPAGLQRGPNYQGPIEQNTTLTCG